MNRIIFHTFIIGVLLCSACTENHKQKKKIEAELRLFKETAIIFPGNLLSKNFKEQTSPDTTMLFRSLKMVAYINQKGCMGCKLHDLLPIYMFALENEHLKNFSVIIILNPSDMEAADYTLTDMHFHQTVFYDIDGSFERLNPHLPTNEQFHTFLLNENNNVVLVGNPAHNEKVKNLYLKEMNK